MILLELVAIARLNVALTFLLNFSPSFDIQIDEIENVTCYSFLFFYKFSFLK